jgi:hypothetical protein
VFLKATKWESIKAKVKYHDTVAIKVLKSDFERKYLNRDSMTVLQQIANYPFHKFEFYSFRFRGKEYVTDLYEAAKQHQQDNLFPQFIIGLVFIGIGIYSFVTKKYKRYAPNSEGFVACATPTMKSSVERNQPIFSIPLCQHAYNLKICLSCAHESSNIFVHHHYAYFKSLFSKHQRFL